MDERRYKANLELARTAVVASLTAYLALLDKGKKDSSGISKESRDKLMTIHKPMATFLSIMAMVKL